MSPVQVFGLTYDVDLVLRTRHPTWDMHELARLATPDGPMWLAKDARREGLSQTVVADLLDVEAWWPEVALERHRGAVRVEDRSTLEALDLTIDLTNADGQAVHVTYAGPFPRAVTKTSGSTMGHSADAVCAVLDVSARALGRSASITLDGEEWPLSRVLGLVPMKAALTQTQAGFSAGSLVQRASAASVVTVHASGVAQTWEQVVGPGWIELVQQAPVRTVRYRFFPSDGALELAEARVEQFGHGPPAAYVRFEPALPDVRRPFEGEARSRFVFDVGTTESQATGEVRVRWEGDHVVVRILPSSPRWAASRPVTGTVSYEEGEARLTWRISAE